MRLLKAHFKVPPGDLSDIRRSKSDKNFRFIDSYKPFMAGGDILGFFLLKEIGVMRICCYVNTIIFFSYSTY